MNQTSTIQGQLFSGDQLATAGMEIAKDHANSVSPGWSDRVWNQFKEWLKCSPENFEFMMEDYTDWLYKNEPLLIPNKGQAFGFLSVKAKNVGLIEFAGLSKTKNPISHGRPGYLWRKK